MPNPCRCFAPTDPAADPALVDFLGTLVHGSELGALRVQVGAPAEINESCGGGRVVACYAVGANRMYVPDQAVEGAPLVVCAGARVWTPHCVMALPNAPWDAVDWGPKYWASAMRVCTHVHEGELFPGNQEGHYLDDPGEGFADSYAHISHPSVPWQFNALMRPSDAGFSAIRRDVLRPWAGPRKRTYHGRLGPTGRFALLGCGSGWTGTSSWRCAAARASALRWSCAPAASQPRKHWAWDDGAASASNGAGASGSSV